MITINLLKRASHAKTGSGRIIAGAIKIFIAADIVLAAIFAGAAILNWWSASPYRHLPAEIWHTLVSPKGGQAVPVLAQTAPPLRDTIPPAAKEPSPELEAAARNTGGTDAVPASPHQVDNGYAAMSPGDKADYELAFAGRVFQLLAAAVPQEVEFNSLTIDSFAVLSAIGRAPNRECAGGLFTNLSHEKFNLLDPPHSFILPMGAGGYRFHIESRISAAGAADSTRLSGRIMPRGKLPTALAGFSTLVRQSGLVLDGRLSCLLAEKSGAYTRFRYALSGHGSCQDFVKLITGEAASPLPCAFSRIRLTGRGGSLVQFDADIAFITVD